MPGLRRTPMRRRPVDNHLTAEEWAQRFQQLLVRSGGMCEGRTSACIAPGGSVLGLPRERVNVQHRRAQGIGGTDLAETNGLANLLLLCVPCHRWVEHGARGEAEKRGLWVRHEYRDGVPVPVQEYPLVLWSGRRVLLDPVVPVYVPHPEPWTP